jgi:hypothetical protein
MIKKEKFLFGITNFESAKPLNIKIEDYNIVGAKKANTAINNSIKVYFEHCNAYSNAYELMEVKGVILHKNRQKISITYVSSEFLYMYYSLGV